ncbi:Cofilin [Daldinia childiae]|uniref:Cofilin n=1 Tax=Daldinia childiae TaxID=326645 RepID=UPI001447AB25|nr:Cofilin [Daldinia childiae]KAF3071015.1 Cofilin [Daldinia childiae]
MSQSGFVTPFKAQVYHLQAVGQQPRDHRRGGFEDKDWETFREKLLNATTKTKSGAVSKGPRYAVYDFEYNLASGEGSRNKITFIAWSPDDANVMAKMVYASSKEALKRSLTGIAIELQANDQDDIEYDTVLKVVSKGLAG